MRHQLRGNMAKDGTSDEKSQAGAILSDQQVARLKLAVVAMTAFLVIGVITLIGRIIYLANRGDAPPAPIAARQLMTPDATVNLPAGHDVKSVALNGNNLLVHHVGPTGDGVMIVDLATGHVASRITIRRTP